MEYKKYQRIVLHILLLTIITLETLRLYNTLKEAYEDYVPKQEHPTVSL